MNLSYALALQDSLVGKGAALLWFLGGASLRVLEVAALKVEHIGGPGRISAYCNDKGGRHLSGRDIGHISTRQIQRLLDMVADRTRLLEIRTGKSSTAEEDYTSSAEAQLQPGDSDRRD